MSEILDIDYLILLQTSMSVVLGMVVAPISVLINLDPTNAPAEVDTNLLMIS